jgi:hypothetical protein
MVLMAIPASGSSLTPTPTPSQKTFLGWSTARQDAYLEGVLAKYGGTYQGMSALEYYESLRQKGDAPAVALSVVYSQWLGQGTGSAIGKELGALGASTSDVQTGIDTASILPSWSTGLASLIGDLESPRTWLRIAEGILGILLVATAISHMSGAGSAVGKAARTLPLVT